MTPPYYTWIYHSPDCAAVVTLGPTVVVIATTTMTRTQVRTYRNQYAYHLLMLVRWILLTELKHDLTTRGANVITTRTARTLDAVSQAWPYPLSD